MLGRTEKSGLHGTCVDRFLREQSGDAEQEDRSQTGQTEPREAGRGGARWGGAKGSVLPHGSGETAPGRAVVSF